MLKNSWLYSNLALSLIVALVIALPNISFASPQMSGANATLANNSGDTVQKEVDAAIHQEKYHQEGNFGAERMAIEGDETIEAQEAPEVVETDKPVSMPHEEKGTDCYTDDKGNIRCDKVKLGN